MSRPDSPADYARSATAVVAQLSVLTALDAGPGLPEGAALTARPTPVFDLDGEVLFWRTPVETEQTEPSFVDVAAQPALGAPLLGVTTGIAWVPEEYAETARRSVPDELAERVDETRYVAYSFPKVAVQLLAGGQEVALVELFTWEPVPPLDGTEAEEPGNFQRWSLLASLSPEARRERETHHEAQLAGLLDIARTLELVDLRVVLVDPQRIVELLGTRTERRQVE